jgi:hypothetical protein
MRSDLELQESGFPGRLCDAGQIRPVIELSTLILISCKLCFVAHELDGCVCTGLVDRAWGGRTRGFAGDDLTECGP